MQLTMKSNYLEKGSAVFNYCVLTSSFAVLVSIFLKSGMSGGLCGSRSQFGLS
jgi:hypothetical protein